MFHWRAIPLVLLLAFSAVPAEGFDLSQGVSLDGYVDFRLIAPADQTSWLKGGLGKFRFGSDSGNFRFAEGVLQVDATIEDSLHLITVTRAEPEQRTGIDVLESYFHYRPQSGEDFGWSMKAGAFFPTISLENDDLGWASPYTLTPSAINSWIGEEFRTIGTEGIGTWHRDLGDISAMGALYCCNEPAGVLMFNRGWAMDDRPTGLFERLPFPTTTITLDGLKPGQNDSEFQEIDGRIGWYAGLSWQAAGLGKISLVRYDNDADAAERSTRDTVWSTQFWSVGARTDIGPLVLISQWMTGETLCIPKAGVRLPDNYQSAFLLASYDIDDWRLSLRPEWFESLHPAITPSPLDEVGDALTLAISWAPYDWLRMTGEEIVMNSRKTEYVLNGSPDSERTDNQVQLSTRLFF